MQHGDRETVFLAMLFAAVGMSLEVCIHCKNANLRVAKDAMTFAHRSSQCVCCHIDPLLA